MKFILILLLVLVLATLGLTVYVAGSAIDAAPSLAAPAEPVAADLARVRELWQQADPRNLAPGAITELTLQEQDLEQAFNYALARYSSDGRARVDITDGVVRVQTSVAVPALTGSYLNAEVELIQGATQLQVQQLRIGSLSIPPTVADAMLKRGYDEALRRYPQYQGMVAAIDHYTIGNDAVQVVYEWQPALLDQLAQQGRELLLSPENQQRLQAHADRLAALTRVPDLPPRISMTTLLAPMMQFAQQRGGSAVEENRAALQVLAMYVLRVDASQLLGNGAADGVRHELRLANRRDYAQHFLGSAGLVVTTDTGLTQSIGELKEIEDTEAGGSGFSFTDLAVDRAGARVGELAVSNEANAQRVQQVLGATDLQEALLMPDVKGLQEFISAEEFRQRFGAVGSAEYNVVADDIEQRVNAMPLLLQIQPPP